MAQVLFGLGKETEALQFEQRFLGYQDLAQWEIDTFNTSKTDVLMLTKPSQDVIGGGY
ncbi:hypothetical protein GO300_05069 [Ralstonia solanacearum]|nr:hypothetical protein [Ralstonia solanacearum]